MSDKALAILAAVGIGGYILLRKSGTITVPSPANPIAGVTPAGSLGNQQATASGSGTAAAAAGGILSGIFAGIASGLGSVLKGTNTTGPGNDTINPLAGSGGSGSGILDPGAVDLGLNDPLANATGNYNNSISLAGDPTNGLGILGTGDATGGTGGTANDPLGLGTLSFGS
jgi:hypothetical protein